MSTRKTGGNNAARTRKALLDAARDVFSERGFDGARVDEIAARAGVNKALINYHFGSKEKLFQALFEAFSKTFIDRLDQAIVPADPPPVKLRCFIHTIASLAADFPQMPRLLATGISSEHLSLPTHIARVVMSLAAILKEGQATGCFRPLNPMFAYIHIISSMVFFQLTAPKREKLMSQLPFPPESASFQAFVAFVEEQILTGFAPPHEVD